MMPDKLKGFLRPYKYKLGRLVSRLLHGMLSVVALTVRVAKKSGFDVASAWPDELQTSQQTFHPQPFSFQDLFLLSETGETRLSETSAPADIICSIIIPVFNKAEYTFQCFRSLFGEVDLDHNEVIVVNNASTDETSSLLGYFAGRLTVIDNTENEGFVDACNKGANIARGRYLVFLNNDTLVQPGWLDRLVETIEGDEHIGAVGSLLIYPTGRIQEAGGIVWQDGNAHHYGHLQHPDDYRYTYLREVDYCSGASLLVRKDLFDRLGGFDRRYAPAYYEDTDLCMGVRRLGFKVVYQPMSRVVHYEGITAGRDISSGLKRFQPINRVKFREKWQETLDTRHYAASLENIEIAADRQTGLRVLVCDETIPMTNRDAGSVRMYEILRLLTGAGRVTFVPLNFLDEPQQRARLNQLGVRTVDDPSWKSFLKREKFDIAILSRPNVANEFFPLIKRYSPATKIVYDTVDIYFVRLNREFELTHDERSRKDAGMYKKMETRLADNCDQVWCVTEADKQFLMGAAPRARVRIIPTIHSSHGAGRPFKNRQGLLFVGSFGHKPNADAMLYFEKEILPHCKRLLPGVAVSVVGSNPTQSIWDLRSESMNILGFVPDLDELLASSRVFICPLRYGAGMKGKIGQAMAAGLPVVTTDIGAEGMGLTAGQEVLIGNDPEEFARLVARLYEDEKLWGELSGNGMKYIEANFSPAATQTILRAALGELSTNMPAIDTNE